ncbi:MAG: RidA family protein [Pseudomonadota bacterium]|nr:RidA family protein [Pseudomonadota bacterium]
MDIEARLKAAGIELPVAAAPAANYIPFTKTGNLVFISGQISQNPDGVITGKLGLNLEIDEGYLAARWCGIALLAQLKEACSNDWNNLKSTVRLGGFVNATPEFKDHPKVINGASDLLVDILGIKGRHARAAVGSSSLPLGVAVEVDGIFELMS